MIFKPANILSILLACLYIYGGSGFYLATFCCGDCEVKGIETILTEGCHSENNAHNDEEDACCSNEHSPKEASVICNSHCNHVGHCSVESYQFDLDNTVQKIRCHVPVVDLLFEPFDFIIAQKSYFTIPKLFLDRPLLLVSSRDILSNNSVLLI